MCGMLSHNATYYNNKTKISEFKIKESYNSFVLVCVTPKSDVGIYYWDTQGNKTYEKMDFEIYGNYLSENDINMLSEASYYNNFEYVFKHKLWRNDMKRKITRIKYACT
jgi:hypothetical protein